LGTDIGYTFEDFAMAPFLNLKVNLASGDNEPGDNRLETFNPMYPLPAYVSGELAHVGPYNQIMIHPSIILSRSEHLSFCVGFMWFWRQSKEDGVYGPRGELFRDGSTSDERYVGRQAEVIMFGSLRQFFQYKVIYSHFWPGEFIRQTGPHKDIDLFVFEITINF
jgi:hypothetical protein